MKNKEVALLKILKSFEECDEGKRIPKYIYIIKYNGKRLTLNSGKSVWTSIGAAKNALRNHVEGMYHCVISFEKINYKERKEIYQEVLSKVEIVEIEDN